MEPWSALSPVGRAPLAPGDVDVRNVIENTAKYVARNGAQFEKLIMEKNARDPRFAFLHPTHPYHAYYVYVRGMGPGAAPMPSTVPPPPPPGMDVPAVPPHVPVNLHPLMPQQVAAMESAQTGYLRNQPPSPPPTSASQRPAVGRGYPREDFSAAPAPAASSHQYKPPPGERVVRSQQYHSAATPLEKRPSAEERFEDIPIGIVVDCLNSVPESERKPYASVDVDAAVKRWREMKRKSTRDLSDITHEKVDHFYSQL
mmetsp:Transcript_6911/g.21017  ORF Transcript_6911/g.21017 Transcript_6911/m.21017 type:complete len:257 (+) Transcript_6911:307-1077(+)